jgi:MoaA/NifB/PqqE/SkfB family radical SAM enzyme
MAAAPAEIRYGLIQLEPTSRCNLSCNTCARSSHPDQWLERDFSPSLFSGLHSIFTRTDTLHLQGWGEPLLLDTLGEYIISAKQAGCRVSFTSNGFCMDEVIATQLVKSGVDGITFSMAGSSETVHDGLRGENSLQHLEESINILNRVKKSLKSDTPFLAVSYLLTPETIQELPQAVLWCARRNIRALAGVQLTHPANKRQQSLQLFPCPEKAHRTPIRLAGLYALFKRVRLQLPPLSPSLTPICDKNPLHNLSISADGTVAPCVFLNVPTSSPIPWLGNGKQTSAFYLGNIGEQSLDAIWQSRTYTDFRGCFARREKIYRQAMAGVGYDMNGIEQLERARELIRKSFLNNPPPEPCAGCSKLNGY